MRSNNPRVGPYGLRFVDAISLAVVAFISTLASGPNGAMAKAADPSSAGSSRLEPSDFRLVGGWRLAQEYPRGALAIDFDNLRIFIGGHAQRQEIVEFALARRNDETGKPERIPAGTGDDVMNWPRLDPVKVHRGFWEGGYVGGLYYENDVLWASPKNSYDMSPPSSFRLYGKNLKSGEVESMLVELPRQAFGGGFVKGKPGTMLIGCGGYESGQGSVAGPTLATVDGKVLIGQANHGTMEFEKRELRPAAYWPVKQVDGWAALKPRDGVGRWACDRVHALRRSQPVGYVRHVDQRAGEVAFDQRCPQVARVAVSHQRL